MPHRCFQLQFGTMERAQPSIGGGARGEEGGERPRSVNDTAVGSSLLARLWRHKKLRGEGRTGEGSPPIPSCPTPKEQRGPRWCPRGLALGAAAGPASRSPHSRAGCAGPGPRRARANGATALLRLQKAGPGQRRRGGRRCPPALGPRRAVPGRRAARGSRRAGGAVPRRQLPRVPQVVFLVATIQQNAGSFLQDLNFADELPYSGCLATKFKPG